MTGWRAHLVSREVVPFYLALLALGGVALLIDAALHLLHLVWIGRWLGIPGVLLIIISLCINFIGDGMRDAVDPKMQAGS